MDNTKYVEWAITALGALSIYLAKRLVDGYDKSLTELHIKLDEQAERITGCEVEGKTLRAELRALDYIE